MAVNWTKLWSPSDDGTVLRGLDIRNIQNDISSTGLTDADSIQGKSVAAPTAADDGKAMYWDNSADRYDYESVEVLMKGNLGTIADDTPNQGDIIYDNGTDFQRLTPGTAGQVLKTNGAAANPSWEDESSAAVEYTTGGNFTAPTGVYMVLVSLIGGGGGGGKHLNGGNSGGGGAGSGEYGHRIPVAVIPGNTYSITIGAGGAGATTAPGSKGADGGTTSFAGEFFTISVAGGIGGGVNILDGASPGAGGTSAHTLAHPFDGSASTGGQCGLLYVYDFYDGGSGGAGQNFTSGYGGGGGGSPFGDGPNGGSDAVHAGCGGGGGTASADGRAGADGKVVIYY